jgi:hypothetical protein
MNRPIFASGLALLLLLTAACAGSKPTPDGSAAATSRPTGRKEAAVDPLKSPGPVTVINSEQIESTGKPTVGQAIESLIPQGSAAGSQVNNRGGGH